MTIVTYDAVDEIIEIIKRKWTDIRPPHITKVWEKRTVGFIDDRSDELIVHPKNEIINYFSLGGKDHWHEQLLELEIRTYQDSGRHNKVVKEVVKLLKNNITGTNYTDLRVIGSFSKNYKYRNMYSYILTISYRKFNP